MVPAGYLYKRVAKRPDWLAQAAVVEDVYSISRCISGDFADYVDHWRHNACWLFDTPDIMHEIADAEGVSLVGATLFYYEVYEQQFDETSQSWSAVFKCEPPPPVRPPPASILKGFDVNCASRGNQPECSPLSCNGLCSELPVNEHCLFATLDEARQALEQGRFDKSEPGPFRIYGVYTLTGAD
jgi:hypothetical protein